MEGLCTGGKSVQLCCVPSCAAGEHCWLPPLLSTPLLQCLVSPGGAIRNTEREGKLYIQWAKSVPGVAPLLHGEWVDADYGQQDPVTSGKFLSKCLRFI